MNSYEAKQQARRERLQERAENASRASNAACEVSRNLFAGIDPGQPILVGHHSERRHRRVLEKSHRAMCKACDEQRKAEHYQQKAASVGTGGISSDDPDAIKKLREQLEAAEKDQERMKAANKAIRAGKTEAAKVAGLMALGFSEGAAKQLISPDFAQRVGFPSYALTNNNASIARLRQRIEDLEKRRARESVEVEGDGYTYREDTEENRVMLIFQGKPAEEIRAVLKSEAFKWSPSRGAWVRQLTPAGIYAGREVCRRLNQMAEKINE